MRRITAIHPPKAQIEFTDKPRLGGQETSGLSEQFAPHLPSPATEERSLAPDIMGLILAEHVRIRKLIEKLDNALLEADPAGPGSAPGLAWATLARFLQFHVDAAEEIAYLALADTEPDAAVAVVQACETDADIRTAVEEAQLTSPGSLRWHMAVQAACSAARSHIAPRGIRPSPSLSASHNT